MDKDLSPNLEWVRAFEIAARTGSFTQTAKILGTTQSAISQRIAHLERHLGVRLFDRRARTIYLTLEGEAWLPHVQQALETLDDSLDVVFGKKQGQLTISASQSIIDLWLIPRLKSLQIALGVQITLQTMTTSQNVEPQDDIIRIRYGSGDWPHGFKAPLYQETIVPMANPNVLADKQDWKKLPRISCSGPRPSWRTWSKRYGSVVNSVAAIRVDTHATALSIAIQGQGVVMGSLPLAESYLKSGALVCVDPKILDHHQTYWLLARKGALTRRMWEELQSIICQKSVS